MALADSVSLPNYCRELAEQARRASHELTRISGELKNRWLTESAARIRQATPTLIEANRRDLDRAEEFQLSSAQIDRLRLDEQRIEGIANGLDQIAALPDPLGEVLDASVRPSGLEVARVRVALGVVFFVFESRPNVTADAAALCVKSGNAVILRGGKEAYHSSRAIVDELLYVAREVGLPEHAVQLVDIADREAVGHFLKLDELIDVAIPRGGESLIRHVASTATMPVMKHFAGNCHIFVDETAIVPAAVDIVENAKCQRPGVCNACETVLVHAGIASEYLPQLETRLSKNGVEIRACDRARTWLENALPATDEDYATEFLDLILAIKVVDSLDEAVEHINRFGSRHTDAILTQDLQSSRRFAQRVDTAAVMINASTRFNDGGEFGLGAEIGISTDKLHARGPCGLRELTTYKYVCQGDDLIRQ